MFLWNSKGPQRLTFDMYMRPNVCFICLKKFQGCKVCFFVAVILQKWNVIVFWHLEYLFPFWVDSLGGLGKDCVWFKRKFFLMYRKKDVNIYFKWELKIASQQLFSQLNGVGDCLPCVLQSIHKYILFYDGECQYFLSMCKSNVEIIHE